MAGLVSPTVQVMREAPPPAPPEDAEQTVVLDPQQLSPDKDAIVIKFDDGSVSVNLNPQATQNGSLKDAKFDDNLAEKINDIDLGTLAEELLLGIDDDERSRKEWLQERADGIKLLALKIEKPNGNTGGSSAGVDNTSRTRHPLMLEAALRFQANARSELLPTDGPMKLENYDSDDTLEGDDLAQALEDDMNYYMTVTASEYYPDTDRMLLWVPVGGSGFKKVYRCPIRRRPVSESVDAADLCVSNAATDLQNADRVTFTTRMRQSVMVRMQKLKVYRDVDLGQPMQMQKNAVEEEKENVSGVRDTQRPEDQRYTVLECYCMLNLKGDEHKEGGEETGIPRPYKVSIEKGSRTILEIRRNWKKDDEMERAREVFVKFPFIPGFGFYDLGLIHIAGNATVAATALLRLMIDSGIFSNFPGFLVAKGLDKQNTTDISVPPGAGAPIDVSMVQDGDIRKAAMPLPYKTIDQALMSLYQDIVTTGSRVAGAPDIAVGEGKQDAPVGTTIALIEQATKVTDSVHKRLHASQSKEFELIVDLFRQNPEDFWRFNTKKNSGRKWDSATLLKALDDYNLVPRADPNTSSHLQRIMRAQALYQMAKANPELFQISAVLDYVLRTLGIRNPDSITQPPQNQAPPPDPKAQAALIAAQAQQTNAQAKLTDVQLRAKNQSVENENRSADRTADLQIAATKLQTEKVIHNQDLQFKAQSQASRQRHDMTKHATGLAAGAQSDQADMAQHATGLASEHALADKQIGHEESMAAKVKDAGKAKP
jgi:hypothetical protein